MYIFCKQLDISEEYLSSLQKDNIFTTIIYAKYWFTAVKPEIASGKDLEFIKDLSGNTLVDKSLRGAVQEKFIKNHIWYLKDDLVGLAFFDKSVPIEIKRKIVQAIEKNPLPNEQSFITKLSTGFVKAKNVKNLSLDDFVNSNTKKFFSRLELPMDFLSSDPLDWYKRDDYNLSLKIVRSLIVTNEMITTQI